MKTALELGFTTQFQGGSESRATNIGQKIESCRSKQQIEFKLTT
jgi:hypothetical protein